MSSLKVAWFIFVYIVVVCPINEAVSHAYAKAAGGHVAPYGETEDQWSPPCEVCPRHGQCVPKVRCPAHVRPDSFNPECHLGDTGQVGVCCFPGGHSAAESEWMSRQNDIEEQIRAAHNFSHSKIEEMFRRTEKLLEHSRNTVVNVGSPDFGQHLSFKSSDVQEAELGRGGLLNLFVAQQLKNRQAKDDDDLLLDFPEHTDGLYCPPPPVCPELPSQYSNINGECNNAEHPSWGAANTGFERLLSPDYSDGVWLLRSSVNGQPLPSPRTISSGMLPDGSCPSPTHNMIFMQFSQFIAHDISAAVMFNMGNDSCPISCCTAEGGPLPPEHLHFACAPIAVDPKDEFFSLYGRTCLNFVRAQLAPSSDCTVGYPKPMNGATHFLDLSHLYGKTPEKLGLLCSGGYMKTFNDYGRELLPLTDRKECMSAKEHGACFESGDNHANQVISLTALHLFFTRQHNRIACTLSHLNQHWDGDRVFYESRRLLQAMFQHIVYNEWLPLLLGPNTMEAFDLYTSPGYSTSYDPSVNPSLLTEFTAAAMRFGHSTVDNKIQALCPKSGKLYEAIALPEVMFEPTRLRLRSFLDRMLCGLSNQPMQTVDPIVTVALTRFLFRGGSPFGLDLASLNIQRGRDYGLRSYNHYRRLCGLEPYDNFDQFPPSASKRLSCIYDSPEDVDLWIGGLLEEHVEGGIIGPTFAHIIAEQFSRLKKGDRYHYANGPDVNPGAFTPSQLEEIKKITLARILCDNKDGVELLVFSPNAFFRSDLPENLPVPCNSSTIPCMDLSKFQEFLEF